MSAGSIAAGLLTVTTPTAPPAEDSNSHWYTIPRDDNSVSGSSGKILHCVIHLLVLQYNR